eukprot:TRINITY_DN17656_c0_g1_i1.p1 TRINITY_DN17656_c0_g1~~TRINITY_DN17656_c0_g1_i1.p1  ORF type:complete len:233 (-),score=75.09 TRINITY_DN17656_c0_g1_i1:34-732(-)
MTLGRTGEFSTLLAQTATQRAITFKPRYLAIMAEGFANEKYQIASDLKEQLYKEIEKSAKSKIRRFVAHDLIRLQKGFEKAKAGSYSFHTTLLSEIWRLVDSFKYKDCINFIHILRSFPEEWDIILDAKLWRSIVKKLESAVDKCTLDECAQMLEVCRLVNAGAESLVEKAIRRLEDDAQGLSAVGFCKTLKYLVEFKAEKLEKYEKILKLLMLSKEAVSYTHLTLPTICSV